MLVHRLRHRGWLAASVLWGTLIGGNLTLAQDPGQGDPNQEILTRGPVHEAFAEPVVFDHQQGVIVPKEAPQDVEEIPPAEKPEGDVIWIPGYWSWDDERVDYIWISGIWRNAPPGLRWVPGYWHRVGNGYQWTSGFWQQAASEEVEYLPQPPNSLENGPPTPQPTENHFWVPGNWSYTANRYAWRAGYWSVSQPDWVWHPANYYWTPSGYVFVDGYWDYPLANRGLLFAPTYFSPGYVVRRPVYTPSVVIQTPALMVNFFARPRYRHYYFGDYYGPTYIERGYRPWFRYDRVAYRYDPLYTYYNVSYGRTDRMWRSNMVARYDRLIVDANLRPPRTYAAQQVAIQTMGRRGTAVDVNVAIGTPLTQVAVSSGMRFEKMSVAQRNQAAAVAVDVNKFRAQRVRLEGTPSLARVNGVPGTQPKSVRLTGSPIVDPGVRQAAGGPSTVRMGEKGVAGAPSGTVKPGTQPGRTGRPDRGAATTDKAGVGKTNLSDPNAVRKLDPSRRGDVGQRPPGSTVTDPRQTPPISRPGMRDGQSKTGDTQPGAVRTQPGGVRPQPGSIRPQPGVRPQPGNAKPERRSPPPPPSSTTEKGRSVGSSTNSSRSFNPSAGVTSQTSPRTFDRDSSGPTNGRLQTGVRQPNMRKDATGKTYGAGKGFDGRPASATGNRPGRQATDPRDGRAPGSGTDKDDKGKG